MCYFQPVHGLHLRCRDQDQQPFERAKRRTQTTKSVAAVIRNPDNNRSDVPAPKSGWMGKIGCECQAFHCGKPNVRLIIGQPDAFLRWRDFLQRRVQNSQL